MKVVNGGTTGNEIFRDVLHNGEHYRITVIQLSHKYRVWAMSISNNSGEVIFKAMESHTNLNKMLKKAEEYIS